MAALLRRPCRVCAGLGDSPKQVPAQVHLKHRLLCPRNHRQASCCPKLTWCTTIWQPPRGRGAMAPALLRDCQAKSSKSKDHRSLKYLHGIATPRHLTSASAGVCQTTPGYYIEMPASLWSSRDAIVSQSSLDAKCIRFCTPAALGGGLIEAAKQQQPVLPQRHAVAGPGRGAATPRQLLPFVAAVVAQLPHAQLDRKQAHNNGAHMFPCVLGFPCFSQSQPAQAQS